MEEVVAVELYRERFHQLEAARFALGLGDGHRPVQLDDRAGRRSGEEGVQGGDPIPVGIGRRRRTRVLGGDRGLERVGSRRQPRGELETLRDLLSVPEGAVLVVEEHERPVRTRARVAPRALQQHQGEQPCHLRLIRHERPKDARQPNRLGAQFAPHQRLSLRRGVALVEDEIEGGEHRPEAVGQLVVRRDDVRDAGVTDLALRTDEALLHRLLRGQERARDLGRLQASERPQRERHAGLGRERRMTAGEDQPQALVGNGAVLDLALLFRGHERLELAHLVLEPARAPDPVDRLVPGGGRDPRARVARHSALRPDLERDDEGVLHRLLREVEVAEHADERRDRPSRLLAEQAVDGRLRSAYRRAPASRACSAEPAAS